MQNELDLAIAKIRSVGDRMCWAQVYSFDDCEVDPETGIADATNVCKRLGIPYSDDVILEFPAKSTFAGHAQSDVRELEQALQATVPADYFRLMTEFGSFRLPGDDDIGFYSPRTIVACEGLPWELGHIASWPVLAISFFHRDSDGDCIGFLRETEAKFGSPLYLFRHEERYLGDDPKLWSERIADSLAEFLIDYIDQLP